VDDLEVAGRGVAALQLGRDEPLVAHQDDAAASVQLALGFDGAGNDDGGTVVSPHGVDGDASVAIGGHRGQRLSR
jgi:hypothetical protein